MAGMALQIADVLGYKPSEPEVQQANLRSLQEERARRVCHRGSQRSHLTGCWNACFLNTLYTVDFFL
jgi:hypothetical protein